MRGQATEILRSRGRVWWERCAGCEDNNAHSAHMEDLHTSLRRKPRGAAEETADKQSRMETLRRECMERGDYEGAKRAREKLLKAPRRLRALSLSLSLVLAPLSWQSCVLSIFFFPLHSFLFPSRLSSVSLFLFSSSTAIYSSFSVLLSFFFHSSSFFAIWSSLPVPLCPLLAAQAARARGAGRAEEAGAGARQADGGHWQAAANVRGGVGAADAAGGRGRGGEDPAHGSILILAILSLSVCLSCSLVRTVCVCLLLLALLSSFFSDLFSC